MSIRFGAGDKLLVHCHAGCTQEAVFDALRARGLLEHNAHHVLPAVTRDELERLARARAIWQEASPGAETLAHAYLRARAIAIDLPPTIRFAAEAYHTEAGEMLPALVAAVAVWPSHSVSAVQRIYLSKDGTKKTTARPAKKSLGSVRGGAVRLAKVGVRLGLAEGIEDALSVMQLDPTLPMWATLGASNLKRVILPSLPLAAEVVIVADNDSNGVGMREATAAAEKFAGEGRKVRIARPPQRFKDFNAALQAAQSRPDTLTAAQRYAFEERAAIAEFDGGMSRAEAESNAWAQLSDFFSVSARGAA